MSRFLLLFLLLCSCSYWDNGHREQSTTSPTEELQERYSLYHGLVEGQKDEFGFVYSRDCDSLMMSALTGIPTGPILLDAAEQSPGKFIRTSHPADLQPCNSDISRDMLLGVFFYSQYHHDLDRLLRIWTYGNSHLWKMGDGDDRTVMSPGLVGLLARTIYHESNGTIAFPERHIPQIYHAIPGYQSHLLMVQVLLEGRMSGSITQDQLSALRDVIHESPENALAQAILHKYTDGDQSLATSLLLSQYPADRLPTTADWCADWRSSQADSDGGLNACPDENRVHSGGDFLFAAAVILGDI